MRKDQNRPPPPPPPPADSTDSNTPRGHQKWPRGKNSISYFKNKPLDKHLRSRVDILQQVKYPFDLFTLTL